MAVWLAEQGHDVHVITAPPYYPNWHVQPSYSKWFYKRNINSNLIVWRCPLFVPEKPSSLLRILHLASFAVSSLPILAIHLFWKPNIVFLVVPTLFCAPGAYLLAKFTGAKSILHIQDFEVDALLGLNLALSSSNNPILKRLAFFFEALMLKSFDLVSTISSGMMDRAKAKGVMPCNLKFLPNWSEIIHFQNAKSSPKLMLRLGVPSNKKIILYSGNMGEKQGLEHLILAAQKLQAKNDLVFLLVGDGVSKNRLIKMATDLNLTNVIFAPLQSYEDLPALLSSCDAHLVIQKRGVADAVLPSKLTNIFAVGGNALITADADTTLGMLAIDHPGIALIVDPESIDALVSGIKIVLSMQKPNGIAQKYAQEFLEKEQVLSKFFNNIKT